MFDGHGLGATDTVGADGTINDPYRIDYLRTCTPRGYIDFASASTGEMKKRHGFVCVDKYNDGSGTLERRKRASFDWYKQVIASNGATL